MRSVDAISLERAIESHFKGKTLADAFVAIAAAYFDEYTDATGMDAVIASSFDHLFEICFPAGETDDGRPVGWFLSRDHQYEGAEA